MDDGRVGRGLRAIRHRLAWRQADVAARAGVSQQAVSRAERAPALERMPLVTVRRIARALDADVSLALRWRGGDLDRLLDEGHASLVGIVLSMLEAAGWETRPEVTFSVWGERGSIDVLAWHEPTRTLLVIEVKTELTSVEETLRRHDAKVRLAPELARERFGWAAATVGRLLVLPSLETARRRVSRHEAVLGRAYPARGPVARRWLRTPAGPFAGILFVSPDGRRGRRGAISAKRIRQPRVAAVPTPPSHDRSATGEHRANGTRAGPGYSRHE